MLNDRVTLVTGGGTVIDKAIAVQLAQNGSKVALPFRDPAHVELWAAELSALELSILSLQIRD